MVVSGEGHSREGDAGDFQPPPEFDLIKPIASVKKLPITLILAPNLPMYAIGDEKRLMKTLLNVVGNAVKFTKEGYVSIRASVVKPDSLQDWRPPEFCVMEYFASLVLK